MAYTRGYVRRVGGVMSAIMTAGKDGTVKPLSSVADERITAEEPTDIQGTLGVMAQMGSVELSGEGANLSFRLTPSGIAMYEALPKPREGK